ncbi:MAG: 50S ribosomal protein L28 [Planctomycetota bacterium]
MARVCEICGKGAKVGRQYTRRGRPKSQGGVGVKTTGKSKRTFKPNLQKIRVMVDGTRKRMTVCAKCIRNDKVTKAPR